MEDFTNDPMVKAITKGLLYQENGGKPTRAVAGKTGEMKSYFQFLPATWKNYAKEVYGDENTPLNEDTESYVVMKKVNDWLKDDRKNGFSDSESIRRIASRWNAGTGEPDAHDGTFKVTTKTHKAGDPSKGLLKKYGNVPYDVPKYATNVENYTNKFLNEVEQPIKQEQPKVASSFGSSVVDKLKNLITGGVAHASAQEPKPFNPLPEVGPPQGSQNMPLMNPKAPEPEEIRTPSSQNMGLLQAALSSK